MLGQLFARLVRPYRRLPLSLAALVDPSRSMNDRQQMAESTLALKECCVDEYFSAPVLECMKQAGGSSAILPGRGTAFMSDLSLAFQGKTSNLQLELNFSRAASQRKCMRGRKRVISSMTSKHLTSECKVAHMQNLVPDTGNSSSALAVQACFSC